MPLLTSNCIDGTRFITDLAVSPKGDAVLFSNPRGDHGFIGAKKTEEKRKKKKLIHGTEAKGRRERKNE